MGTLYLGGPTIQEVDGEIMMGLSIYGVAVMDGSLYSRFYGLPKTEHNYIRLQTNNGDVSLTVDHRWLMRWKSVVMFLLCMNKWPLAIL